MAPEPALVDSDDFHQRLVENTAEGLLTIDDESNIVHANPAVEDILGYAPEELVGSSKMKIIPERLEPVHAQALDRYVETGERNIDWDGIELPALHKDGHEVPTLISLREHRHEGEQYFAGIIRTSPNERSGRTGSRSSGTGWTSSPTSSHTTFGTRSRSHRGTRRSPARITTSRSSRKSRSP